MSVQERRAARLAAVQALYQLSMTAEPSDQILTEFLQHRLHPMLEEHKIRKVDEAHFLRLYAGVVSKRDVIDEMIIANLSADWRFERVENVLKEILRAAIYELLELKDVPARVIISEYVELAKSFSDKDEPRFVNHVLDRLAHVLREDEFTPAS